MNYLFKILTVSILYSIAFTEYQVGDTISLEDQVVEYAIGYGEHPLIPGQTNFLLSETNGDLNGGLYTVSAYSIQATW